MSTNPFGKVEITGELSDISRLLTANMSGEIEKRIRQELVERTTPIIDSIAKQMAENLAVNLKAYTMQHSPLGNTEIRVVLHIDRQQVTEIRD